MAVIYDAEITPGKVELVQSWIGQQRWYAAKGRRPRLRQLFAWRLDDPEGQVGMETLVLADESGDEPVVYQVPVTYRPQPLAGAEGALLGTMEHSVLGTRYVYDAPHDPVYAAQLLRLALGDVPAASSSSNDTAEPSVLGARHPRWRTPLRLTGSRVLRGEQSNTSIIVDAVDDAGNPSPVIMKIFRSLHPGQNPDVTVQGALVEAGSTRVPAMAGWVEGSWADPATSLTVSGHLAVVQEYLSGVQDAWRVVLEAIADGDDFVPAARELGRATAQVHASLAETMGSTAMTDAEVEATLTSMRGRYAAATREVPELAERSAQVEQVLEAARHASWPALQRIHGDYHLGQVLHAPERGWILLDFEGEPLRPLSERSRPDQPLRDVAGMLRSFDYAGGTHEQQAGDGSARGWVDGAQRAFLDGYAEVTGTDPRTQEALLAAYVLDKALYEVVYEARNRPDWVPIPSRAIARLLGDTTSTPRHASRPDTPTASGRSTGSRTPHANPTTASTLADPSTRSEEQTPVTPSTHPSAVPGAISALARGRHQQPHDLLGQHLEEDGLRWRVFRPGARTVEVETQDGTRVALQHEQDGVWSAVLPGRRETVDYRIRCDWGDGFVHTQDDPYRFAPTLGEIDIHLIGEGRHEELWTVLGAHEREYDGPMGPVRGTSFAVWAPRAKAVHVIGAFNSWDGVSHPMRQLGGSGVWELFVPGVGDGDVYRYRILGADDVARDKFDPMAQRTECPPATGSVVTRSTHSWGDAEWMQHRAQTNPHTGPMSIYEVHLGSWRQGSSYRDLAEHLVNYVVDLGFTHVEFLPVMEHPFGPSWGYQVTGYFAPTARFGTPDDFRHLVDRLHQAGIGVIVDWVPAHFPKDEWALARFDGLPLYEHPDPRRGDQPDWGTHVFDFGRTQVRNFLVANACYWMEEFHVDGLRVDAVASMLYLDYSRRDGEWLPNQYGGREHLEAVSMLQEVNATAYKRVPGVMMIAEESTSWPGVTRATDHDGLGFGLKWNMGWMNDTLRYLHEEPVHRQYHHNLLTFPLVYAYSENYILPISHDEVVHGKGSLVHKAPGSHEDQLATTRAYLAYMWSHPGKQLLFMGCEFAQTAEWADGRSLDWWLLDQPAHYRVHNLVKELNRLYRGTPAMWALDADPAGFEWLSADNAGGNTLSYLRYGDQGHAGQVMAVVVNFSGSDHGEFRVGVPRPGGWKVALDTSGFDGDFSPSQADVVVQAEEVAWDGQPWSLVVRVARLSTLYLVPEGQGQPEQPAAAASEIVLETPGLPSEDEALPEGAQAAHRGEADPSRFSMGTAQVDRA